MLESDTITRRPHYTLIFTSKFDIEIFCRPTFIYIEIILLITYLSCFLFNSVVISLAAITARARIICTYYTIAFTPDAVPGYCFELFLQISILIIALSAVQTQGTHCCHRASNDLRGHTRALSHSWPLSLVPSLTRALSHLCPLSLVPSLTTDPRGHTRALSHSCPLALVPSLTRALSHSCPLSQLIHGAALVPSRTRALSHN